MTTTARSRTARRVATWAALPAALLISGVVVGQASYSAFNATTVNPSNNWNAGTVTLADDDSNTALFTANDLQPGSTGSQCIAVTSTGSLPSTVKLYGTDAATTKDLSSYIDLVITQGTGGSRDDCSGFTALTTDSSVYSGTLSDFGSAYTDYANGAGSWTPAGGTSETRVFKVSYTVDSETPNTAQGGTAALGFTWEAQND